MADKVYYDSDTQTLRYYSDTKVDTDHLHVLLNNNVCQHLYVKSDEYFNLDLTDVLLNHAYLQTLILDKRFGEVYCDIDFGLQHNPNLKTLICHVLTASSVETLFRSLNTNHCLQRLELGQILNNKLCLPHNLQYLTLKAQMQTIIIFSDDFRPVELELENVKLESALTPNHYEKLERLSLIRVEMPQKELVNLCHNVKTGKNLRHLILRLTGRIYLHMAKTFCEMVKHNPNNLETLALVDVAIPDFYSEMCHALEYNCHLKHLSLGVRKSRPSRIKISSTASDALAKNFVLQSFRFIEIDRLFHNNKDVLSRSINRCPEIQLIISRNRKMWMLFNRSLCQRAAEVFRKHYHVWPRDQVPDRVNQLLDRG